MREWVVKLLGGISKEEHLKWVEASEIKYLHEELAAYKTEVQRLTNLMLVRSGFLIEEKISQVENKHEPINKRETWTSRQRKLEQEDAKRAADEVERRWKTKEAQAAEQQSAS